MQRTQRELRAAVASHAVAGFKSEVQCGHRVALIGMLDRQNAHSDRKAQARLACVSPVDLLTTRKITKPTIKNQSRFQKQAVVDGGCASFLCSFQRVVVPARQIYVQVGEVDLRAASRWGASGYRWKTT